MRKGTKTLIALGVLLAAVQVHGVQAQATYAEHSLLAEGRWYKIPVSETGVYKITADDIHEYNVIVNCTPCGMYPHSNECPDLPYEAMDSHNLLYDLIYNPDETQFMHQGAAHGATVKNGLEMLLLQAFASWDFWHQ